MAQSWFQTGRALPAGRALCLPHVLRASHHDLACRTADRQVDRCARFNILSAAPAAPASDDVGGYPSAWPCPYRSEEHTSELPSLMRISYAVFCLKKKLKHSRMNMFMSL